jgi:uncharacterized protein YdhG (YjbR/CyaY superfamily)
MAATIQHRSVDEYIAAQPAAARLVLAAMRAAIRKALPGADESISYHMPTYKLAGEVTLYFAGWKAHVALYPATAGVVAAFAKELAPYEVQKGTIRFPLPAVPIALVGRIARQRAAEVTAAGRVTAAKRPAAKKPAAPKKPAAKKAAAGTKAAKKSSAARRPAPRR